MIIFNKLVLENLLIYNKIINKNKKLCIFKSKDLI